MLVVGVMMMIPLASMMNPPKKQRKTILIAVTAIIALLGAGAILQSWSSGEAGLLFPVFVFAVVAYSWIANLLVIK
jgi:hypothetical protein